MSVRLLGHAHKNKHGCSYVCEEILISLEFLKIKSWEGAAVKAMTDMD